MVEILPMRSAPHAGLSLVADERSVRLEGINGVSRFSVRGDAEAAQKSAGRSEYLCRWSLGGPAQTALAQRYGLGRMNGCSLPTSARLTP